jgi:peptide/nickel transport system substrate-binding protein
LKEAGAEGMAFELFNRNIDQPYKFVGTWLVDEWSKIGLRVTQRVVPIGPAHEGLRSGTFDVALEASCNSVVNPLLDVQKYLPSSIFPENYGHFHDQPEIDLYQKMLRETDGVKQRALMRDFEKRVLDTEAHAMVVTYWNRIVPLRSYVKGWKVSPSHYVNQDLANVWLDR